MEPKTHPTYSHLECYPDGRIYSRKSKDFIKGDLADNGYLRIYVSKGRKRPAHRLIMEAFVGESELQVNHKDGNKLNNSIDNLEYVTASRNILHAWENGFIKRKMGNSNTLSKHDELKILTVITMINANHRFDDIAATGYMSANTVRHLSNNDTWPHFAYLKSTRKNRRTYLDDEKRLA